MKRLVLLLIPTIVFLSLTAPVFAGLTDGLEPIVSFTSLGQVLEKALPLIFGLVALLSVVIFSIGAFRYLVSRGDEKAADSARGTMTGAVVGLVIVLGSVATSGVFKAVFGQGLLGNSGLGSVPTYPNASNSINLECAFRVTTGSCIGDKFDTFGELVTFILLLLLTVGALAFFFILIWGGIRYMTARGDEKAVSAARGTLTNGVIGLLLMIAAIAIIRLITEVIFKSGDLIT